VRFGCVLVGLGIALVIGVVLFNNSLQSSRQEFELKCDNIKEILSSEVENNLNASFVILGLVASVPNLNESVWTTFTSQTLFLRPNVQTLLYCQRVLAEDRPSFEKDHNGSILYILPNGTLEVCPYNATATEYAPVVYETQDEHLYLVDIASYPILQMALFSARDSGVFTLSPPSLFLGSWQMGAYLAYYGQIDPTTLTSNSQRMQACRGYVATALNITDVFGVALSRYADDADMDVVALYVADPSAGLNTYYNCSSNVTCALPLYDPASRGKDNSEISVPWTYGTQNFELQCLSKHNLKLLALRTIIAWPLLMAIVVVFCSAIVSLVLKRMNTIERDVATMEKMNADLTAAKIAAEAADKAKSSFLATVSHEIRWVHRSP
jgi:histidine kinase 2/3/4 (cytokinin receptor)